MNCMFINGCAKYVYTIIYFLKKKYECYTMFKHNLNRQKRTHTSLKNEQNAKTLKYEIAIKIKYITSTKTT